MERHQRCSFVLDVPPTLDAPLLVASTVVLNVTAKSDNDSLHSVSVVAQSNPEIWPDFGQMPGGGECDVMISSSRQSQLLFMFL